MIFLDGDSLTLGEEFSLWRGEYTSYYQVPVLYNWHDLIIQGALGAEAENGARVA